MPMIKSSGDRRMDIELARMVAIATTYSGKELSELVPTLKEHCDAESYDRLLFKIGSAIAEIGSLAKHVFDLYPELEREFQARVDKYGRPC
jgi:hypothetical protein